MDVGEHILRIERAICRVNATRAAWAESIAERDAAILEAYEDRAARLTIAELAEFVGMPSSTLHRCFVNALHRSAAL
jgi:AraC-like DNA-binding protein